jgi:hypothetical protein
MSPGTRGRLGPGRRARARQGPRGEGGTPFVCSTKSFGIGMRLLNPTVALSMHATPGHLFSIISGYRQHGLSSMSLVFDNTAVPTLGGTLGLPLRIG